MSVVQVLEYLDARGRSPYASWFDKLNANPAAKVAAALYGLGEGNFSNVKGVGGGVFERKIDFGPGYRIYFGKDGKSVVILLGGSRKGAPARGDRDGTGTLGRLQAAEGNALVERGLTWH
jgi:putative addiction module killer protein